MNADRRVALLRERIATEGVEGLIVSDPVNIAYLTGFERVFDEEDAHAALVTEDALHLYTDGRYAEAANRAAAGTGWEVVTVRHNLYETVCDDAAEAGAGRLALEDTVPYTRFRYVSEHVSDELIMSHEWVEEIRSAKEAEEIGRIEAAQALTDRAFEHVLGVIKEGVSEREIALDLEFFMRREGSEGVAFPPIVASGPNSALPHAKVTDRLVQRGDFVKLDFGARVDGYCADMTRTLVMGRADERQREVYEAVLAANEAGIEAVVAGGTGAEIDRAARAVLETRGLGALFTHGLGHGVGLQVHELPGVGPRSDKPVPEGSVITIEPGVYEEGRGGVRIEDLVVVEADGARVLTRSPKNLIEL